MTALYLLAQDYRAAAAKLADLDMPPEVISDTLESMAGDLELKAQNVALMVRALEADAAAVSQWAKDANARAKAIDLRAERLRQYLADNMSAAGIERIEGPGVRLTWRKSSAVVIDEPSMIPAEFMAVKPPPVPEPSKALIGEALKAGREVPGARIEQRRNLQIA